MKPQMIEETRERATLNPKPNNIIYIIGCRVDELKCIMISSENDSAFFVGAQTLIRRTVADC
jgi:hypothetical protein